MSRFTGIWDKMSPPGCALFPAHPSGGWYGADDSAWFNSSAETGKKLKPLRRRRRGGENALSAAVRNVVEAKSFDCPVCFTPIFQGFYVFAAASRFSRSAMLNLN